MIITLHKLSHLILKTALRGSVIIASFTRKTPMPRAVREHARDDTANEGWVIDVSPGKLLQNPCSVTAPAATFQVLSVLTDYYHWKPCYLLCIWIFLMQLWVCCVWMSIPRFHVYQHHLAHGPHKDTSWGVPGAAAALKRKEVQHLEPCSFHWLWMPVSPSLQTKSVEEWELSIDLNHFKSIMGQIVRDK